jgi:hypothetical protein
MPEWRAPLPGGISATPPAVVENAIDPQHNKPLRVNRHETKITVRVLRFDSGSIPLSMNAFGAPPTSCRTLSSPLATIRAHATFLWQPGSF